MAVRIKSKWHRSKRSRRNIVGSSQPKTVEDLAGVVAFNIWKIAKDIFTHMENEGFRFAEDRQVTDIMIELIAFMIQIADRMVYGRLAEDERAKFVTALAKHLGQSMLENQLELLGPGDYLPAYIETLNNRFGEYAECTYTQEEGPGYAFRRLLGDYISRIMASSDNKWVVEQIMDIEAPKAVNTLRRLVTDVVGLKRRPVSSS